MAKKIAQKPLLRVEVEVGVHAVHKRPGHGKAVFLLGACERGSDTAKGLLKKKKKELGRYFAGAVKLSLEGNLPYVCSLPGYLKAAG
jgi:hypothetical protein